MISSIFHFFSTHIKRPLLALFIVFSLVDLVYINVHQPPSFPGQEITVTGRLSNKEYDTDGSVKRITVGNALCYVNQNDLPPISSIVSVTGTSSAFKSAMNLGGFDAKAYYAARNINLSLKVSSLSVVKKHNSLQEWFHNISLYMADSIDTLCHFESGTIRTLILGDKRSLSNERKQIYQTAGVSHFLVISGLHISAIGGLIYSLCRYTFKKRIPACLIAILFLFLYGMLVGFGISVMRALIMFTVRLFSYIVKRTYDQLSALSLAGIIVLIKYPYMLTDSSFVYSFSTVFFISLYMIYYKPSKSHKLSVKIINLFSLPIFISFTIMPVTLYYSGSYSILSIIYNLMLLPLSLPILIMSFLAMFACLFHFTVIARLFDFIIHLILLILDNTFKLSAFIGLFNICGKPHIALIVVYYLMLALLFIACRKYSYVNRIYISVFILTLIVLCFETFIPARMITMLYVGQGECVAIKTGTHSAVISDCGSTSDNYLCEYTIIPWLKATGINTIETIYLSHPDKDHTSAVTDFISSADSNGITIKAVALNGYYLSAESYSDIILEAGNHNINVIPVKKGVKSHYRNLNIACLSPDSSLLTGDTNSDSLVLLAEYSNLSILLTGDITSDTEKELLNQPLHADILKVPHHGSSSSSDVAFISRLSPRVAIISAGINNRYGHPHRETIDTFTAARIPTFVTKDCGEIDILPNSFSHSFNVQTHLQTH